MILAFHGVVDAWTDEAIQLNHLELRAFERLVERLARTRAIVPLADIVDHLSHGSALPANAVALTFDDGYVNNAELVAPALERLGAPWVVYVSTRFADDGERLPTYVMRAAITHTAALSITLPDGRSFDLADRARAIAHFRTELKQAPLEDVDHMVTAFRGLLSRERWAEVNERFSSEALMRWDLVRDLASRGVEIGSHTHDHAVLHARQPRDTICDQIRRSKDLVEQHTGRACTTFAYPNGTIRDISNYAVAAVRAAGYESAVTNVVGRLSGADPFQLPRVYVGRDIRATIRTMQRDV